MFLFDNFEFFEAAAAFTASKQHKHATISLSVYVDVAVTASKVKQ